MDQEDLIDWARIEANRLRTISNNPQVNSGDAGRAAEFLRLHAGSQSHFYTRAVQIIKNGVPAYAIRNVASLLEGWADLVEAGLIEAPFEARAKVEAATDLMEQVHILLDDRKVHPAAPVMLAGAALEEFLRSMLVVSNSQAKGKPSINSYAAALREAEVLTAQDLKDVTAWGGMRNDAAHGHFGAVTIDRARIMVDGINLFMRQKAT